MNIRMAKAKAQDLPDILKLLASVGLPEAGIEEHLANFFVSICEGQVNGCVGVEIYGSAGLLRSLAVGLAYHGKGIGGMLMRKVLAYAREKGLHELYLLTMTAERYFLRYGFTPTPREEVDRRVARSIEFTSVCPKTAICMKMCLADVPATS